MLSSRFQSHRRRFLRDLGVADRLGRDAEEAHRLHRVEEPDLLLHPPGDAGRAHLTHEAADLIYHLFVMLAARDVALDDVEAELARRFGVSGLDEKASRPARRGEEGS